MYFFLNFVLIEQFQALEDRRSINDLKGLIRERFREWFPPSAWGKNKFYISFESTLVEISLSRGQHRGIVNDNIRVGFSKIFEENYLSLLERLTESSKSLTAQDEIAAFRQFSEVRSLGRRMLSRLMGDKSFAFQIYVPAGRSFFTSMGRTIAAFEQSKLLDEVTVRFGRFFRSSIDPAASRRIGGIAADLLTKDVMHDLFNGELKFERDKEYVQTSDGRKIPFSALSSGQQELVPLWLTLNFMTPRTSAGVPDRWLVYIEEPEAHLFPSAQNTLVQLLAAVLNTGQRAGGMILTTHSPYVLAKINNLVKAGLISEMSSDSADKVASIIPRQAWLKREDVAAYALKEGRLVYISESDGLIDGSYLDEISGHIAREFSRLLELEIEAL
jgi:hypothetical protein